MPEVPVQWLLPDAALTDRTLKLESSITTTCEPSDLVTCTSYAALESELSVSVVALVTVPPGTAARAAADADASVSPVSGVSLELGDCEELEDDEEELLDEEFVECRFWWAL